MTKWASLPDEWSIYGKEADLMGFVSGLNYDTHNHISPGVIYLLVNADKNSEMRSKITIGELTKWFSEYTGNPAKHILR